MNRTKTYVVDQGWMRSPELAQLIQDEPQSRFVVPDVAMVEMSKSGNWEGTMRSSLAHFYPAAGRTFMSLSVGEALQIELQIYQSIEPQLLPDNFTQFLRSLIKELAENRPGPSMQQIHAKFPGVFAELKANDLLESDVKPRLAGLVQPWLKGLKESVMSLLRRTPRDDRFWRSLIQANAYEFGKKVAMEAGMTGEAADAFLDAKPVVLRYLYVFTRHSLWWAVRHGWDTVASAKAQNHFLDQDYVLIGTFFDELLTKDGDAREAYEDLKIILSTPLMDAVEYCNTMLNAKA